MKIYEKNSRLVYA